jgi:hypothetical protein
MDEWIVSMNVSFVFRFFVYLRYTLVIMIKYMYTYTFNIFNDAMCNPIDCVSVCMYCIKKHRVNLIYTYEYEWEHIYWIVSTRAYKYISECVYALTIAETKWVFFLFVCLFDREWLCDVIIQSLIMMMNSTHLRHWHIRQSYLNCAWFNSAALTLVASLLEKKSE